MNKTLGLLIAIFILVVLAGVVVFIWPSSPVMAPTTGNTATTTPASGTGNAPAGIKDLITVESPLPGSTVTSPIVIKGMARGTWYFEASFPAVLLDAKGNTIAQMPAQAQGDWMTDNLVPFTLSLTYPPQPASSKGTLILKKDNPSGDPARDQSVSIPVIFK